MTVGAPDRARPGRQRSEAADHAILSATLDLLAVQGYGGLTMAAVISRSGVSSATLYRRWPTKQQLVAAALASIHAEIVDIDAGSLESDVAAMVRSLADAMSIRREDIAEDVAIELRRNPDFRAAVNEKFMVPRLENMGRVLDRARARGELGPGIDAEAAMSIVAGPLHHRVYVMGRDASPAFVKSATVGALAALRAVSPV
jgi:AcrR family transcriptional regulator